MNLILGYFSSYIRNLAIFIIFMAFVGIIAPNGKYRNYLNLVMGFVLMFLIVSPIVNFFSSWDDILISIESDILAVPNINTISINSVESVQVNTIQVHATNILKEHVLQITREHGFVPISVWLDTIMENPQDFFINRIVITIQDPDVTLDIIQNNLLTDVLTIEEVVIYEVVIGTPINIENNLSSDDLRISELKNYLAQFYNMSSNNIHIIIS